jgi:hypothetical protein
MSVENYLIWTARRTNGVFVENGIVARASAVFKRWQGLSWSECKRRCIARGYHWEQVPCYFTCVQCGSKFFAPSRRRSQSDIEWGPFCNHSCYGAWKKTNFVGNGNPNFVAQSNHRAAGQLERNRVLALERDNDKCVRCGSQYRLQVHHVEPWAPGQADPHRLDNLETLCHSCHASGHVTEQWQHNTGIANRVYRNRSGGQKNV